MGVDHAEDNPKSTRKSSISLFRGLASVFVVDYPIYTSYQLSSFMPVGVLRSAAHGMHQWISRRRKKSLTLTDVQVTWDCRVMGAYE